MKQVIKSKPGYESQEKELEDVLSNLHSLKKLYSLLYVKENDLKSIGSEILDEQARLLLKKLLDGATAQALKSHSQIISGQLEESVRTFVNNSQSKDVAQSCHAITAEENGQSRAKQTSPAIAGGETCSDDQICQKRNRKRQDPAKGKKTRNRETQNSTRDPHVLKRIREIRVGFEPNPDIVVGEGKNKTDDLIDVYKEVAREILQIEGETHADRREKVVGLTNDTGRVGSMATRRTELEVETEKKKPKDGIAIGTSQSLPRQKISKTGRKTKVSGLPGESLSCRDTTLPPSQSLTGINKGSITSPAPTRGGKSSIQLKNELPGRLMSQKAAMSQSSKKPIHEKHDSASQKARKPRETHRDSMQRREKRNSRIGTSKPSNSLLVVGPTLMRNESLNPVRRKSSKSMVSKRNQPHEITKRPSFRDHTVASARNQSYRAKSGTHIERKVMRASDDTDCSGTYKGRRVFRAMDDSDSCSTCTSQDEGGDTSSTYQEMGPTSSEDSYTSEEEDPQLYGKRGPTSRSRRLLPRDQTKDGLPPKDRISRWRRLKDKLIIFHHHHHHHHVHDQDINDVDTSPVRHATPNHLFPQPTKKPWRQILHRPSKEDNRKLMAEIYGERVAERTPRKHQQGYFHALLDSLWRHVWYSKKSKPSMRGIKRLGKGPKYGKVAKKIHWWQKFSKRGVKLASSAKPRVNGGLKTKRLYLHAAKMS